MSQNNIVDYEKRTAIIGETGTGKTFFMENVLKLAPYPAIIVDVKEDIHDPSFVKIHETITNDRPRAQRVVYNHVTSKPPIKVVYKSSIKTPKKQRQLYLANFLEIYIDTMIALKAQTQKAFRPVIFVVDEVDLFHHKDNSAIEPIKDAMEILFTKGRSVNLIGWLGAQRGAQPHNDMLTQCQQAFIFYQKEHDLKALSRYFGGASQQVYKTKFGKMSKLNVKTKKTTSSHKTSKK